MDNSTMTERELLCLVYGALKATDNEKLDLIHDILHDFLFPDAPMVNDDNTL
jgi:hypothetical protein